ncbi:MAG: hypothetical protein F6K55_22885 [Moorea sp. SIO4A3]|nr:hypothetical protein [Moorena sp. SIO4A3]
MMTIAQLGLKLQGFTTLDSSNISFYILTLPGLKARGFLDQRVTLNRCVPIFDAAKNQTISKPKTRQYQVSSQFTTDPAGDSRMGRLTTYLEVP